MKKTKEQKGITLVALIITIIVLLILAVVAIRAVRGDGIIQHAQNARDEYIIGQDKEKEILRNYLTHLEENVSEAPYIVHNDTIPVGGVYKVAGTETELSSEEGKYVKFPEEVKTGDIYKYGDYEYRYNEYYSVSEEIWKADTEQNAWNARVQEGKENQTSYGNILSTINGKNVTHLRGTFGKCANLVSTPAIPNTVVYMRNTFQDCSKLKVVSKIPNSVIDMYAAFTRCKVLTVAPEIPAGVINMEFTFKECESLVTAPLIPDRVKTMIATFDSCTSLVTAPSIPDSVTDMAQIFNKCTSLKIVPHISNSVTNMKWAFEGCTSLVTVPPIPDSVTNLKQAFYGCTSLAGDITINAVSSTLTDYGNIFFNTKEKIYLIGTDETLLTTIASKYSNVELKK